MLNKWSLILDIFLDSNCLVGKTVNAQTLTIHCNNCSDTERGAHTNCCDHIEEGGGVDGI